MSCQKSKQSAVARRRLRECGAHLAVALLLALLSAASPAAVDDLRLLDALRAQNRPAVEALVKDKVDVNVRQGDGATALHWAAHWDDLETVRLLLRAGARPDVVNDLGISALAIAAKNGNAAMVEVLLKAGAPADSPSATGVTPLMAASKGGSIGAVAALLAHGADVNVSEATRGQSPLMWASAEGHEPIVRMLIEHRADVRARSRVRRVVVNRGDFNTSRTSNRVEEIDRGGFTPVMFAARSGHVEVCRTLIGAGVDVDEATPDGTTVLVMAAHSGHGPLAALLLEWGADPNLAGAGYAPLHAAVLRGDQPLVQALLSHGADVNAAITKGNPLRRFGEQQFVLPGPLVGSTPFLLAARYAEVDIMKTLLANGADATATMPDGSTALMLAAGVGWADVGVGGWADRRGRFLAAGTQPGGPDWSRTLAAVEVVAAQGIDVNAVNRDGDRAVHGAAPKGFDSVIEFLAAKGAMLDAGNKRALTPLKLAARGEFKSTVELLHKLGVKE